MGKDRSLVLGVGNGMAAGALWGMVFLVPALLAGFGALQLAAGRYLIYGLVAVLLLWPRWAGLRARVGPAQWRDLFGLSLLGNLVYFIFLALAVQWAGGAAAALIVGMVPVLVAVWAARAPDSVPLRPLLPSLALCVAGTVLVAWAALDGGGHGGGHGGAAATPLPLWQRVAGLLAAVAALLSWTLYSVRNVQAMRRNPTLSGHDWSLLTGVATGALALGLVPLALWLGPHGQPPGQWVQFAGASLALAVGASVLGNACWNRATSLLPLGLGGQMIVFETLFALLYGFVWQQRWPSMLEWLAIAALAAGVVLCARVHARWQAPASPLQV